MIVWHNPAVLLPKPYADVLLAVRDQEQAAEGFRTEEGSWVYSTGHYLAEGAVYAWADRPAPPAPAALFDFWKREKQKA